MESVCDIVYDKSISKYMSTAADSGGDTIASKDAGLPWGENWSSFYKVKKKYKLIN